MKKQTKYNLQLILGFVLAIFGMALLVASFFVPPLGIIDTSVLAAIGEVFTFSGCLLGIDYHYKDRQYKYIMETNKDNGDE